MKIPSLQEFAGGVNQIYEYLTSGHNANLKQIVQVLRRLTFADNFESFEVVVTIPATSEIGVENKLKEMPTRRIIVRSNSSSIVDGDTAWTKTHLYLKNTSATEAIATVIFIK